MKIVYKSVYTGEEELQAGIPLRILQGSGTLSVITVSREIGVEVIHNGNIMAGEKQTVPAEIGTEIIVKCGNNKSVYSIKALAEPLGPDFAAAYRQFNYEYCRKSADEIKSIRNGSLKLYAVDESTEIIDWTEIFDQLEAAYPAFKAVCEKPKSHLRAVNEVRPIDTVKRTGYECISYLAAHSEDWLARTASGLKPARLFSRVEDDDYQIYENRVVKTLIDLIILFLRRTERDLREKYAQLEGIMNSNVQTGSFGFDVSFQKAVAEMVRADSEAEDHRSKAMDLAEVLGKRARFLLKRYISFRNTKLYKHLKKVKPVSNPLHETNILILDKHYSIVFKLWKAMHKILAPKERDKEKENMYREDFLYYKQFCMTLIGYAAHVMEFSVEKDGQYIRTADKIAINIVDNDGIIEVYIKDITEHELLVPGNIVLPIKKGEKYKKFRYDGQRLYWAYDISNADIDEFAELLVPDITYGQLRSKNQKKQYNTQLADCQKLRQIIGNRENEYSKTKPCKIIVLPCMVDLKHETLRLFKDYVSEKLEAFRKACGADLAIAALPKCQEVEQSVVEYGFKDDEKVLMLPLSMFDINSFRRIQNVLIRKIVSLGKDTCPCCGGKMRKDGDQMVCDSSCRGLVLTTTICPEKDCKNSYRYLSYNVSEDTINKMELVDDNNFFQQDSLYQYKNIVKMRITNKKLITVCPHCGR